MGNYVRNMYARGGEIQKMLVRKRQAETFDQRAIRVAKALVWNRLMAGANKARFAVAQNRAWCCYEATAPAEHVTLVHRDVPEATAAMWLLSLENAP
jgi:hypothetical protein